jgi:isopentenyl-diphosphate delta-isomerase
MNDYLILVDEKDRQWGKLEKLMVHQLGLLHRAFSVFIFNSKGELLLQQRADEKYHSGGLWTNTCCSHPQFGEELSTAIERRLMEEMGMCCKTEFAFSFIYNAEFINGLTEHEFDHVYFGLSDDLPVLEKSEVKNYRYITLENLEQEILNQPELYTEWIKLCLPMVKNHFQETIKYNLLEYASI